MHRRPNLHGILLSRQSTLHALPLASADDDPSRGKSTKQGADRFSVSQLYQSVCASTERYSIRRYTVGQPVPAGSWLRI